MRENYRHFSNFIPGLNFIRNQVIKPLLFATEKVVEQYITAPATTPLMVATPVERSVSHPVPNTQKLASESGYTDETISDGIRTKLNDLHLDSSES